jgi:hypothetical protein
VTARDPRARRFWVRAEQVRRDHGVSLKLAAQMVREDQRRASVADRDKTPAQLVREIRQDVRAVRP